MRRIVAILDFVFERLTRFEYWVKDRGSDFLDWLFPSRIQRRLAYNRLVQETWDYACRADATGKQMAEAGLRWLEGDHGEHKSVEEAMLAVDPGASGAVYALAEAHLRDLINAKRVG